MKTKTWVVKRCGWPYPEGYATFDQKHSVILDTGLTKEEAQKICDDLNNKNVKAKNPFSHFLALFRH